MGWPVGRPLSQAHKRRISRAKRASRHSPETRERQQLAHEASPLTGAKFRGADERLKPEERRHA